MVGYMVTFWDAGVVSSVGASSDLDSESRCARSRADRAIGSVLELDRGWVADLLADQVRPVLAGHCATWLGPVFPNGDPKVSLPGESVRVWVKVTRLVYAFHRGFGVLPAAMPLARQAERNTPVLGRVCLVPWCVEHWHVARMRRQTVRPPAVFPVGCRLPDEPRFRGEMLRRACGGCEGHATGESPPA